MPSASLSSMPWPHSWSNTAADLAGVPAAAAGAVEVDGGAVPEGVAGLVDVDVGGELRVQPGVGGQPAARLLGQLVELVERRARGRGVAGAAAAGVAQSCWPLAPPRAMVPVAELALIAPQVHHAHVAAGQRGGHRAAGLVEDARAVGEVVGRGAARVRERHGPAALHRAALGGVRADPGAGRG